MTLKDNPEYSVIHTTEDGKHSFYIPTDMANGYHISRRIAASAQDIFSASGITKDLLNIILNQMVEEVNSEKKNDKIRSNMAVLVNNLKYRMSYPIDDECALRMTAIYVFIEGENPSKVDDAYTQKKVRIAKQYPDTHAFFLTMGIKLTPAYSDLSTHLNEGDYFKNRAEILQSLMPTE